MLRQITCLIRLNGANISFAPFLSCKFNYCK